MEPNYIFCNEILYYISRKNAVLIAHVDQTIILVKIFKRNVRASLVAQWLGICLPMQGTRVRALVWEDPTCCGATRPVSHNY